MSLVLHVAVPELRSSICCLDEVWFGNFFKKLEVSLVLHVAVPELRSSTFGWMKSAHLFSMLWSYAILFILYLWGLDLVTRYPASCRFLGKFSFNKFLSP